MPILKNFDEKMKKNILKSFLNMHPEKKNIFIDIYSTSPWGQCYKTFLSIIDQFSYQARVFVRLDWKSLPMTF